MQPDDQQGIDPTPTPAAVLLIAADALPADDKREALVHALDARQARVDQLSRRLTVLYVLFLAVTLVGVTFAVRIADNTNAVHRQNEAIQVYCQQTNGFNAETREAFVTRFAGSAPNPQDLADFAALAWPHRDCSTLVAPPLPQPSVPPDQTPFSSIP